ncbi:hypothetical protein B0H12DRAFT_1073034 [Mycena haematopus]|nr:hypothetical protein B0H12DRAFT_1073034 [Mycena haematopus]
MSTLRSRTDDGDTKASKSTVPVRTLLQFFDLEAQGSDEDEDDGDCASDASEDTEYDVDVTKFRVADKKKSDVDDEQLRMLAAKYDELARLQRATTTEDDSDTVGPLDVGERLVRALEVAAAPLYVFSIPPATEIDFLQFMIQKELKSVASATTRALGSGLIYVESADISALQKDLKAYKGSWRIRRAPNVLEVLESVECLELAPPTEHIGRYRRLKHRYDTLQPGDIVFVHAENSCLAIPRPHGDSSKGIHPQTLFDEDKFIEQNPGRRYERRNNILIVDGGRTMYLRNGLQLIEWTESKWRDRYKDDMADPTDEEIELFAKAGDISMKTAPSLEPYSALQGGDFVVAIAGAHEGRMGRVVNVLTKDDVVTDSTLPSTSPNRRKKTADCFCARVAHLRPHILCLPRPINVDDHIKIVDGDTLRNETGIVVDRFDKETCEAVHLKDVQLDINVGDLVMLIRGDMTGHVGMIVAVLGDGKLTFFPCDHGRIRRIMTSNSRLREPPNEETVTTVRQIVVSSRDISPFRDEWYAIVPPDQQEVTRKIHKEWLREMHTGKGYKDMEVMICYSHQRKGAFGSIVDYRHISKHDVSSFNAEYRTNKKGKLDSVWTPNESLVFLTVQLEGGMERMDVPMNRVVERHSRLPIWEYKLLDASVGLICDKPPKSKPRATTPPLSSSVEPFTELPQITPMERKSNTMESEEVDGETSGEWLTLPALVRKRVDVRLVGMNSTRWPRFASARAAAHEGETGYLHPFPKPIVSGMFTRQNFKVKLDGSTASVGVPADALRPCRQHHNGSSIGTIKGRVIVIGPDIHGDTAHIGQYAETMPGSAVLPLVGVRFCEGYKPTKGVFRLASLCRSINVRVMSNDNVVADSTTFFAAI